jgi:DNA-binding NarL/FixJ family response regulator
MPEAISKNDYSDRNSHSQPRAETAYWLILVEDKRYSIEGLVSSIRKSPQGKHWQVDVAETEEQLNTLITLAFPRLPTLVSIDLGLPPAPSSQEYGLELLQRVHQKYEGLKLMVHSQMNPTPYAAQLIMAIPASYVCIGSNADIEAFVDMLPWIAKGFKVYSPSVASILGQVIVIRPDPLADEEWKIVARVARGLTNPRIAEELTRAESAIAEKIQVIARRLNSLGFIRVDIDGRSQPNRYRGELKRFYDEYAVRYGRGRL